MYNTSSILELSSDYQSAKRSSIFTINKKIPFAQTCSNIPNIRSSTRPTTHPSLFAIRLHQNGDPKEEKKTWKIEKPTADTVTHASHIQVSTRDLSTLTSYAVVCPPRQSVFFPGFCPRTNDRPRHALLTGHSNLSSNERGRQPGFPSRRVLAPSSTPFDKVTTVVAILVWRGIWERGAKRGAVRQEKSWCTSSSSNSWTAGSCSRPCNWGPTPPGNRSGGGCPM